MKKGQLCEVAQALLQWNEKCMLCFVPLIPLFLHSFSPAPNHILRGRHMKFSEARNNVAALKLH